MISRPLGVITFDRFDQRDVSLVLVDIHSRGRLIEHLVRAVHPISFSQGLQIRPTWARAIQTQWPGARAAFGG
jgi:hypothetical protein